MLQHRLLVRWEKDQPGVAVSGHGDGCKRFAAGYFSGAHVALSADGDVMFCEGEDDEKLWSGVLNSFFAFFRGDPWGLWIGQ